MGPFQVQHAQGIAMVTAAVSTCNHTTVWTQGNVLQDPEIVNAFSGAIAGTPYVAYRRHGVYLLSVTLVHSNVASPAASPYVLIHIPENHHRELHALGSAAL